MLVDRIIYISVDTPRKVLEVHGGGNGISACIHRELLNSFVWKTVGLTYYLRKLKLSKILAHYVRNSGISVFKK